MNTLNRSRNLAARPRAGGFLALFLLAGWPAMSVTQAADLAAANAPAAIPWSEIGAKAGADYQGDGLAVTPTESGARLHCVFQRLNGEATAEGLWLTSTVTNTVSDRFRVTAMAVGHNTDGALTRPAGHPLSIRSGEGWGEWQLPRTGSVSVCGQTVRLSRPGLTEEYSVSMDGVRQDFIVEQAPPRPPGGELMVKLAVRGAEVEPAAAGARLVLDQSGRKIAYSRLRVTDATGKELPARIEVASLVEDAMSLNSWFVVDNDMAELAVVVNDAEAVYPVRIDPTFSDANWVSMGGLPGANGPVEAAVIDGSGNLYIGGVFTIVGNAFANNVAEWNGSGWSALGSGISGGDENAPYVLALAVSGSTLYAGGYFTNAGGSAANSIAQWNGSSWSALGSGMNEYGSVSALAVSGSTLYAGGYFTNAGGSAANNIAQWNGGSWSPLGSGMTGGYNPSVSALAVSGGTLYAGGEFTTAGSDTNVNSVAQWNGSSWSALGSGIGGGYSPYVSALAVSGSTLYAAGGFFTIAGGGSEAYYIAQWNGSSWSPLGSGMNSYVYALVVSGSTLYAGGDFTLAGNTNANFIAQWNGSSWSPLGSGIGGFEPSVYALAVSGSTLYAGGYFTTAGGSAANYIAKWNGSSWSPLGSGMGGDVSALAVSGGTLYAGGYFTTAGGSAANYIAKWNGSSWSPLGSGMNSEVSALAVSGSTLYAGGGFTTAGGTAANCVAQWNGSRWSALGSGMNNFVTALAVSGGTLYAGGDFQTAGGSAATNIAQWSGSSWSALGSGISGEGSDGFGPYIWALAVSGSTLYAGGDFSTAGGTAANSIAQWNGSSWSALGSGMNSRVDALAVSGSTLYAGGGFTTAGTNVSAFAALAYLPSSFAIITTNAAFGFTNGVFGFDVTGPSGSSVVIQASTNLQTWIPLQTNLLGSGPLHFSDSQPTANVQRFYRAQLSP
jgi:hypothetical protein